MIDRAASIGESQIKVVNYQESHVITTETELLSAVEIAQQQEHGASEDTLERLEIFKNSIIAYGHALEGTIESREQYMAFEERGMDLARKMCLVGPKVLRRYVLFGDKAFRCSSLVAIMSRDFETEPSE